MKMNEQNEYQIDFNTAIYKLALSKREENIAVFMGAGVSSSVNPAYPVWSGVTQRLKEELPNCKIYDALDVAQEYSDTYGEEKLSETLRSLFPDSASNQEFYNELLKCRPKYLITTNWDSMLQNSIETGLHMYDTIANDKELMNSKLFNKYIKMHGDFQHNFVLTRKSYDTYSENYPLIENFIKSILCTNTVIFIGYSLSDEDFQQILNWIKISAPAVPKFYCAFDSKYYDENTALKFNSYGITTFKVSDFTELFRVLNENEIKLQEKNPIHSFAEMLRPLREDKAVLLYSLRRFVSNCGFEYLDEYKSLLKLFTVEYTYDYKENYRNFFKKLIEAIASIDKENYTEEFDVINEVFVKAGISGLAYAGDIYLPRDNNEKSINYMNFNYEISNTDSKELKIKKIYENVSFENKQDIEKVLELNTEVIKSDIKRKKYRKLFISYFNHNKIIGKANYAVPVKDSIECIDIEGKYLALPSVVQNEIFDIYNFITEERLRDILISLREAIRTIKDKVQNSWMAVDRDRFRWSIEHKNLTDFVLLNDILIEDNYLFRQVQQSYVEIAVLRKSAQENTIKLNKTELFSCIRYFDCSTNHHNLLKLLSDNKIELTFDKEVENWLIDEVLKDCIKNYQRVSFLNSKPYLFNLLVIFSKGIFSDENMHNILLGMKEILTGCVCNGYILNQIKNIIMLQSAHHKKFFKDFKFLPIFISVVNKYIEMHAGPEEQMEFTGRRCGCYELLYKIAAENKEEFDDVAFLEKIQIPFKEAVFDAKVQFYINVLMPFYIVGNDIVRNYLKDTILNFLNNIPSSPVPSQFGEMINLRQIECYKNWYILKLIELNLKSVDSDYIQNLELWLTDILKQPGISSEYELIINEILLLSKIYPQFDKANKICKELIEKYKSMRFFQI